MSALSSFISHQLKSKVAIKSPFTKRSKVEAPSTSTPPPSVEPTPPQPVIEIGEFSGRRPSLDFYDSATPSLNSQDRPLYTDLTPLRLSHKLQLELDLSPDSEPLSDWFSTSFPRARSSPNGKSNHANNGAQASGSGAGDDEDKDGLLTEDEALKEGMKHISRQDMLDHLEAMEASDFGVLSHEASSSKSQPSPLKIPQRSETQNDSISPGTSRPISAVSSPLSSAISGTTLARQLMANPYILSYDNRSSRYRSFGGLARSDSTTLPPGEHPLFPYDHFEVDPEAPPIPSNAEALYIPPKTPRTPNSGNNAKTLKRRGSTGTIATKVEQDGISPPTRPSSVIINSADVAPPLPLLPDQTSSPTVSDDELDKEIVQERNHIPPPIDLVAAQTKDRHESNLQPESPPSTVLNDQSSPRQLEEVLDYYSFLENPEVMAPRGYQPVFTPITEESLSQLSPSTPYRNERRESQRSTPIGARSPLKSNVRKRSLPNPSSKSSDSSTYSPLASIPDRPHSVQLSSVASSPSHKSNLSLGSVEDLGEILPKPPPLSKIFAGRSRSGSAPSPIKVIRDPNDRRKYTLALGEDAESSAGTPTTGGSDAVGNQTFPESALSNGWSAAVDSPAVQPAVIQVAPMPDVPLSATMPGVGSGQPSLAQQILLTRAQTTIRDRHSRQGSFSGQLSKRSGSPFRHQKIPEDENEEGDTSSSTLNISSEVREHPPPLHPPPKRSLPPSPVVDAHQPAAFVASTSSQERLLPPSTPLMHTPSDASVNRSSSGHDASDAVSIQTQVSSESANARIKSLPTVPVSPSSVYSSSPSLQSINIHPNAPPSLQLPTTSLPTPIYEMESTASSPNPSTSSAHHSPATHSQNKHPATRASTNTIDALLQASTSLGSPPPYYSVVDLQQQPNANGPPPLVPKKATSPASKISEGSSSARPRDSTLAGKSRLRPPLPAGPRGPTIPTLSSPIAPAMMRDRSGSQGSLVGIARHNSSRRTASTPMSPRFQTPAVKWKGYTLEVAKWTFSSAQLQAIVSRAIRDSALSSSIRLLKLDSLDGEIPEELHRLEMHRTDIKSKYKALIRRRANLFDSLTFHISSSGEESSSFAARIVEELKELAAILDSLAEDLYTTDEQIAQLNSLVQVHSASALSVALRKLNGSLMKQKEENDYLRQQNVALEQERDEAWNYAQQVADEYDSNFSDKDSSKRSSHVSAKRKSSIRLSRAGLRSQSRRQSQRSSIISHNSAYGGISTPVTSRSMFHQDIPPLPPIPKRRPEVLTIYEPPLRSSGALSANDMTPDSETREMVQVQEELYSMLGIMSPGQSARVKRSHSILGLPSAGLSPPPLSARFDSFHRRSSLPGASAMVDAHNALDADHHAVLATFATLPADL